MTTFKPKHGNRASGKQPRTPPQRPLTKPCRTCGTAITFLKTDTGWRPVDADGSYHNCGTLPRSHTFSRKT